MKHICSNKIQIISYRGNHVLKEMQKKIKQPLKTEQN